ncbi:aminotransferase class V-fold PLP-dependent enzyme [Sandaracinobacter sp. RS1-74]|uniref:cysteine desulfurase family protein n=1 Tax=Sandaracinobacteroides sayramensis TaxID=2913411 RepID=UPI001EDAF30A|nr:aminotransferase class V-fold PLP-dependent enzyme [Sandaracinobacteroides sayramensis]
MPPEPIDLDAQATSPLSPAALKAMLPLLQGQHWNPHSAHRGGRIAKAALEVARAQVAAQLGEAAEGLVFTSGATEANNLALKGYMESAPGKALLTFATEHSCVLESARHLERKGVPLILLPVRADGLPDLAAYEAALTTGEVALVSAMWVNNEVGSIWPIREMAAMAHAHGARFHTDAAQAFAKLGLSGSGADMISLSAHKIGGPKGIGALWVRPGVKLVPQMDGGGQEAGIRSGTQAPALAAGFGAAASAADPKATEAHARLLAGIALETLAAVPHRINGPAPLGPDRWPGNLSVTFPGIEAGRLISALPGLALSSGSACSSGSGRPSHVLAALGLPTVEARQTLRLGWNDGISADMLLDALHQLVAAATRLRPAA